MSNSRLLDILVLVSFLSVAVGGVWSIGPGPLQAISVVLLALIALAFGLTSVKHKHDCPENQWRMGITTFLIGILLALFPGWTPFPILFFILAAYATVSFKIQRALVWISVYTVITLTTCVWANGLDGLISSLSYIAGFYFFGIFGYIMAQAEANRRKTEELLVELQTAHYRLKEYAVQVEQLTIERERNHLAREVHDTLGHQLTVSVVQLEGAQRLVNSDPARASQIIATVREQMKSGLNDLRRIVATLRAPEEEDSPLLYSIRKTAGQFQEATGITVSLDLPDDLPPLDKTVKLTCYRLVQEGLTNIQKHAQATSVDIRLLCSNNWITLTVKDNGVGMTPDEKGGFGLPGLKERAGLVGGVFEVTSPAGEGVWLTLKVPLAAGGLV